MSINIYPSIAKVKRNGVYENLPGFVQQSGDADIEAMIATKESASIAQYAHPQGSYFILNDVLYQADANIPVSGTIAVGTNCHVAILGNDVAKNENDIKDLKSSIEDITGNGLYPYTSGIRYSINNINTPEESNTYASAVIPCASGDIFYVKGYSTNTYRLWTFWHYDGETAVVDTSAVGSFRPTEWVEIIAPQNATFLTVNNQPAQIYSPYVISNRFVASKINDLEKYDETLLDAHALTKNIITWEAGTISSTTGYNSDSNYLIRSDFYRINPHEVISFTGVIKGQTETRDRYYHAYFYNINKEFISPRNNSIPYAIPTNAAYIRFIYGFNSAEGITVASYGGVSTLAADFDISSYSQLEAEIKGVDKHTKTIAIQYVNQSGDGNSTERLSVYVPTTGGFVRYDYGHSIKNDIACNCWRMTNAYFCNEQYVEQYALTYTGEWECALLLDGRWNFSGGISHGNELQLNDPIFFVDGTLKNIRTYTTITEVDTVSAYSTTTLYDPGTDEDREYGTTAVAYHGCSHLWSSDGLTIRQTIRWLVNDSFKRGYLAMLPVSRAITDKWFNDYDYSAHNITSEHYNVESPNVSHYCVYSDSVSANIMIVNYPKNVTGGNKGKIEDHNTDNYNKVYFYVGDAVSTVNSGDEWKAESLVKFDVS